MTEKVPKSDAALAVRGFGMVPVCWPGARLSTAAEAIEEGQASGSACSLNFPPGSKLSEGPAALHGALQGGSGACRGRFSLP